MSAPALFRSDSLAPVRATRPMLHEMAAKFAEEQFAEQGSAPFMWLLGCGSRIVWVETDWEDDNEKDASLQFIRKLARQLRADCYAMMAEAWVSVTPRAEFERGTRVPPSERPKAERDDILMVLSVDHNENKTSRWLVTERRHGLNFLGPRVDQEDMPATGQMLSILKGWK